MSYTSSWNKIVAQYNKNINCKEEIVQNSWEMLFSMVFNYEDSDIDSQRSVKMGVETKRADILIKNDNADLFVVELKRHTLHEGQEQLFSYLNQLKMDLGILVCDNLYIYDYDFTTKENSYSVLEIPFVQDNQNGIRFVELFSKDNFDKQKIKDFIRESNDKKNAVATIKNEITEDLVSKLLKNFFKEKYPEIDIEDILLDYIISIKKKSLIALSSSTEKVIRVKEDSQDEEYYYNNQRYAKRKFVLTVVTDYVRNNPDITYNQLKQIFPDKLQGKYGVFQDDALVIETVLKNHKDKQYEYNRRYFTKCSEKIKLNTDGRTIIVSGEWGHNFDKFFNRAKELGLNVEKK